MLPTIGPAVPLIAEWLLRLVLIAFILLRRRPNPAVTLSWIIVILVVPLIGIALYLLIGEARLGRGRIRRHEEIVRRMQKNASMPQTLLQAARPKLNIRDRQIAALGEAVRGHSVLRGNDLDLISDTDAYIQHMTKDIDEAEHHCHLLYYIYLADDSGTRVGKALMAAAKRGVKCRLLVDAVGSKAFLRSRLRQEMARAGVHVVEALPANVLRMAFSRIDLRNHRKITVIDGHIGYTGSQNIADAAFAPKAKYAPWYDVSIRAEGPIVRDMQMLFIEDWFLDTGESLEDVLQIEPPIIEHGVAAQMIGTGPDSYNTALRQLINTALSAAQEELILTTPYFVPDEATTTALCTSARRGIQTHLVLPARNDSPLVHIASRSYYEVLLDSGVHLHEFGHGLLHAKTMTIDRDLAMVSTANLDRRSFELNFEISIVVYDTDFASRLRFLQRAYIARSKPIHAEQWRQRGWATRLTQNAAGILSPLL